MNKRPSSSHSGFTLIQLAVMVAVSGIIFAAILPGGTGGSDADKVRITKYRMEKIEEAMNTFMYANLRRPVPSDPRLSVSDTNFGRETPDDGINSSNYFFVPFVSSFDTFDPFDTSKSYYIVGSVPIRALGLSDEFALDGYGRRIMYAVDSRAMSYDACRNATMTQAKGNIQIRSSMGGAETDKVMWTLMSYGKDGHGAFATNGSAINARLNAFSTDTATLNNAFSTSGVTAATHPDDSTFQDAFDYLVKSPQSSTFDDIVWYKEDTKNTCCTGPRCLTGVNYSGSASGSTVHDIGSTHANHAPRSLRDLQAAIGDINGDGVNDIAIGYLPNAVHIVFGKRTDWANPASTTAMASEGVTVTDNSSIRNYATRVSIADINGDGYGDVLIGSSATTSPLARLLVLFGGANGVYNGTSWIASGNINTSTILASNNSNLTRFTTANVINWCYPTNLATGDFNGDGITDMYIPQCRTTATPHYLVFGRSNGWGTGASPLDLSTLNGTTTPTATRLRSGGRANITNLSQNIDAVAAGDFNGDGYDDFIMSAMTSNICNSSVSRLIPSPSGCSGKNGEIYVVFGRAAGTGQNQWFYYPTSPEDDNAYLNLCATGGCSINNGQLGNSFSNGQPYASVLYNLSAQSLGYYVTAGDVNNDGLSDIVALSHNHSGTTGRMYVYFGRASWTRPIDLSAMSSTDGIIITNLDSGAVNSYSTITFDTTTYGSWRAYVADVSSDGRSDLIFSRIRSDGFGETKMLIQPSTGWPATIDFTNPSAVGVTAYTIGGSTTTGLVDCYASLAGVGDVNADGFTDLIFSRYAGTNCSNTGNPINGMTILFGKKNPS